MNYVPVVQEFAIRYIMLTIARNKMRCAKLDARENHIK